MHPPDKPQDDTLTYEGLDGDASIGDEAPFCSHHPSEGGHSCRLKGPPMSADTSRHAPTRAGEHLHSDDASAWRLWHPR